MDNILNNNTNLTSLLDISNNIDYKNKYKTSLNNIKENERKNISKGLFLRTSPRRKYNNFEKYLNKLNEASIKQFNDFLKLLMEAEKEIEEIKIELAKREDFNCEDAFKIFDKENNGYLTKDDFKYGLYLLDINVDDFIINLIFKRFDLIKKDELNYPDFFDMMIPFEKIYRNNIEKRIQKSNSSEQSLKLLTEETKEIMKNVLNVIIRYEQEINEKRKELSFLIRKVKDIFNSFDKNGIGYFGFNEFINYMKENELLDDKRFNVDLLFIRFDKNRNGKIIFEELIDELEALY